MIGDLEAAVHWVGIKADWNAYGRWRQATQGTGRQGEGGTGPPSGKTSLRGGQSPEKVLSKQRGAYAPAGGSAEERQGVWSPQPASRDLHTDGGQQQTRTPQTTPRSVGEDVVTPVWLQVPSSQNNSSPTTGPGHRTKILDVFFLWAQFQQSAFR